MTAHFGVPGGLVLLGSVGRGFDVSLDLPTVVHEIAGSRGGRVVQRMGAEKRTFQWSKDHLSQDDLSVLEAFALGAYGPGPFVLLDSARRNLLSANQSTGTDALGDTTGFVALAGTISSSTVQADQGLRSLAWAVTAANQQVMTGYLGSGYGDGGYGYGGYGGIDAVLDIPVLPSTAYSAGVRARLLGSTGTARLDLYWYTAAGVFISSSAGTPTVLSTSAFTSCPCLNVTSPSNAALARLLVQNTGFGAATTIYSDKWQLALGATLPAWTIGTGVPRVSFIDRIAQSYLVQPYVDASVTLVEV